MKKFILIACFMITGCISADPNKIIIIKSEVIKNGNICNFQTQSYFGKMYFCAPCSLYHNGDTLMLVKKNK